MAIERVHARLVPKPWGRVILHPFAENGTGEPVGEIWFTRAGDVTRPALLVKLLFTSEPLSIQVHPSDAYAGSIGLPNGKSEAWYILAAAPDAKVALGLQSHLTPAALRTAIEDGSIVDDIAWRPVTGGEVIAVPAGTIHAIGAGLVLAEVQQNSDATFRLFDFGRGRDLDVAHAVGAAQAAPAGPQVLPSALDGTRTLLVATAHFVIERIVLAAGSSCSVDVEGETWLLVLDGEAVVGTLAVAIGEAVFLDAVHAPVSVGRSGLVCLVAYPGTEPIRTLLREDRERPSAADGPRRSPADAAPVRATAPTPRTTQRKARS